MFYIHIYCIRAKFTIHFMQIQLKKKTEHGYKKLAMRKNHKEGLLRRISAEPCNVVVCDTGRIS